MSTFEFNEHSVRSIEQTRLQTLHTISLLQKAYSEIAKGAAVENCMLLIDALMETTEQLYFVEHTMALKRRHNDTHSGIAFQECISQLHNHHVHNEFISLHTFSLLIDYLSHFNVLLNRRLQPFGLLDDN